MSCPRTPHRLTALVLALLLSACGKGDAGGAPGGGGPGGPPGGEMKLPVETATLKTETAAAITQARTLAAEFGLTAADVFPAPGKPAASMGQPKYRNPETGVTWTGRGKPPTWILGKDRAQFLIDQPSA